MNNQQDGSQSLDATAVAVLRENWMNCLPGNLSNLFYKRDTYQGIQRISYFSLSLSEEQRDSIGTYLNDYGETCIIRILMGCQKDKDGNKVFSPVFELTNDAASYVIGQSPLYFSLIPNYDPASPKPSIKPIITLTESIADDPALQDLTEITAGIADLFHKRWLELSDAELADSFSGVTRQFSSADPKSLSDEAQEFLTAKRVRSYVYSKPDTTLVIRYIINPKFENSQMRIYMGAGLTVRLTHPYNFRPMLFLPGLPSGMPEIATGTLDDPDPGTYFERSQPCPPYCEPPED